MRPPGYLADWLGNAPTSGAWTEAVQLQGENGVRASYHAHMVLINFQNMGDVHRARMLTGNVSGW